MVQPPSFKPRSHPNVVYRLKKPLYGLKQAPRVWHSMITQFLHQINFRMSKFDNALLIQSDSSGQIFIIIYVDDFVIGGEHLANINKVKMLLSRKFEMKDMNKLHYFKGIEVIRAGDGIMLSQRHYILNLLFKFGMTDHVPISTPFDRNLKMHTDSGTPCEPAQYQQIIGSLICLPVANSGKHCAK